MICKTQSPMAGTPTRRGIARASGEKSKAAWPTNKRKMASIIRLTASLPSSFMASLHAPEPDDIGEDGQGNQTEKAKCQRMQQESRTPDRHGLVVGHFRYRPQNE